MTIRPQTDPVVPTYIYIYIFVCMYSCMLYSSVRATYFLNLLFVFISSVMNEFLINYAYVAQCNINSIRIAD